MRAGAIINAVQVLMLSCFIDRSKHCRCDVAAVVRKQVREEDVYVGYDDGRVLVWDASTGGREPKAVLATLPEAVQSLWLYRQTHLVAVSATMVMTWEVSDAGAQLLWVRSTTSAQHA